MRLLTGVGRFHEMNYIIHLLLECDEFESLVHPKVEKVSLFHAREFLYANRSHFFIIHPVENTLYFVSCVSGRAA